MNEKLPQHKDVYFFEFGIDIEKPIELANKIINLQKENQKLKEQYCERTDCSGRIGNSKKVEELEKENQQLKEIIDKAKEYINKTKYSDIVGLNSYGIKEFWFIKELLEILKGIDK